MDKRATLKLNDGNLETGFSAILQIGNESSLPAVEIAGRLPAAPELKLIYQRWQAAYRQLGVSMRLEVSRVGFATNVSQIEDCYNLAEELRTAFNRWLRSEAFRPVQEKLLERLCPEDTVRLLLQTRQCMVQRLPWHLWDLCDRYPKLEIALSAPAYEKKISTVTITRKRVRILAVLGHSQGLDIQTDRALLNHLPDSDTDIQFLIEPDRQTLDAHLWDTQGWDILFFAGHSSTQTQTQQSTVGQLFINPQDVITIPQLKHALCKALTRGLKIAIFNSCDGLGLAQALADLQISQILVMREPVPDQVAHTFLKSFLEAFGRGEPLHLAVREAREKLQGLEDKFPCASWLPTLYQNPAESPPQWHTLAQVSSSSRDTVVTVPLQPTQPKPAEKTSPQHRLPLMLTQVMITLALIGLRQLGLLASWELKSFDWFMRLRPHEASDARLLIVAVTEDDVQTQDPAERRGSLSDWQLLALLKRLDDMGARAIGLDIYRDFPVRPDHPELATILATNENLFVVCKGSDRSTDPDLIGIAPPPEMLNNNRIGFSDFITDPDGVLRRHLLVMTQEAASPCTSPHSLSTLLTLKYVSAANLESQFTNDRDLQVGDVTFERIGANAGGYHNIDAGGHQILLNYRSLDSPDQIAEQVTLSDVLEGRVKPEAIRDRIVLIGATNSSYGGGDRWMTPYSQKTFDEIPGVYMQAQMTSQLVSAVLDGRPLLKTWSERDETLWIFLWGGIGYLIMLGLMRNRSYTLPKLLAILLVSELGLLGTCWLLFTQSHYWVPWVPPAVGLIAAAGSVMVYDHS